MGLIFGYPMFLCYICSVKKTIIIMKDNSWQNFMNKGQAGQKGKGGNAKSAANTKGNGASAKQMNRRTQ